MKDILIIGPGSHGMAMAKLADRNGHGIRFLGRDRELIDSINEQKMISIPNVGTLRPKKVNAYYIPDDADKAYFGIRPVFITVPTQAIQEVLEQTKDAMDRKKQYIFGGTSKGIEIKNGRLPYQVTEDTLDGYKINYGCISGPGFAIGEMIGEPTTLNIAATNPARSRLVISGISQILTNPPYFNLVPCDDIIGIEVMGALSKIGVFIIGMCQALRGKRVTSNNIKILIGPNTESSLVNLLCVECGKIIKHFGGNPATAFSLAGLGDILLCSSSRRSRNRGAGNIWISKAQQGKSADQIKREITQDGQITVECFSTAEALMRHFEPLKNEIPFCFNTANVICGKISWEKGLANILKHYS